MLRGGTAPDHRVHQRHRIGHCGGARGAGREHRPERLWRPERSGEALHPHRARVRCEGDVLRGRFEPGIRSGKPDARNARRIRRRRYCGQQRGHPARVAGGGLSGREMGLDPRASITAAFHTTRLALPGMLARNGGASSMSPRARPWLRLQSAYVAAKHGIVGFTKTVALEVADKGVTVNAICPGYAHAAGRKQIPDTAKARGISEDAVKRDVLPARSQPSNSSRSEVGALACFLSSDAGASITGGAAHRRRLDRAINPNFRRALVRKWHGPVRESFHLP